MYRIYVVDRNGTYWLRRWFGSCPLLTTNRDHASVYGSFREAEENLKRLRNMQNDAHIDTRR